MPCTDVSFPRFSPESSTLYWLLDAWHPITYLQSWPFVWAWDLTFTFCSVSLFPKANPVSDPPLDFLIYFIYLSLSWLPKILKPCQIPSSGLFTSPCLIWSVANSSQIIPFHFSPLLPRLALFLIQTFIFLICTLSYSNLLYQWLQPVLGSLHQIHLWALHIQFIL